MLGHHAAAIKSFFRAARFVEEDVAEDAPLRVAVVAPGPPGVGKSHAALEYAARKSTRLLEPSHDQAAEREREGAKIRKRRRAQSLAASAVLPATQIQKSPPEAQHIQGLGRQCFYLPEGDTWSQRGWAFGDVACDGCSKKPTCPSYRQFWDEAPTTFSVHAIQGWRRNGLLVLDEVPLPVTTTELDLDCLGRMIYGPMHQLIRDWRAPIQSQLLTIYNALLDKIYNRDGLWPEWGEPLDLARTYLPHTSERYAIDAVAEYLDVHPIPKAPPEDVRAGRITSSNWPANFVPEILAGLIRESQQIGMVERDPIGRPTMTLRVYGDKQGRFWKAECELRRRWRPPAEPHVILDSTAGLQPHLYKALYPHADVKQLIRDVPVPGEYIEAHHYETFGLAKRRCLDGQVLTPAGEKTVLRVIRELTYNAKRVSSTTPGAKPRVGVITHRAILRLLGFNPTKGTPVLRDKQAIRKRSAAHAGIETALRDLEAVAHLVVGYHGGVIGSNLFNDVRILAVWGDPTAHIGKMTDEAEVLGISPQVHIDSTREAAAVQEVFRARLLDAAPDNLKTVLYFGAYAPKITGLAWREAPWAQGGRIPALAQARLEVALVGMTGTAKRPFYGTFSTPLLCRLHATSNKPPLEALRAAGVDTEAPTRAEWEMYRRAAARVGRREGLTPHELANPLGDRRPIVVWATSRETAEAYLDEVRGAMGLLAEDRLEAIVAGAPERDEEREIQEVLSAEVAELKAEMAQLHTDMHTAIAAMKPEARGPVKAKYRAEMRRVLARWREVRDAWRGRPRRAADVEAKYRGLLPLDHVIREADPPPPPRRE